MTARHVVDGLEELVVHFVAADDDGRPRLGRAHRATMRGVSDLTTVHPDDRVDLAVVAFDGVLDAVDAPICLQEISVGELHPFDDLDEFGLVHDVTFIGHPGGLFDREHLTPLVRRGASATPPLLDYDGLPAFVIDAPVYPGSSGSPVFAGGGEGGTPLLGVLGTAKGLRATAVNPTADGDDVMLLDLGLVYKSSSLLDLLRSAAP